MRRLRKISAALSALLFLCATALSVSAETLSREELAELLETVEKDSDHRFRDWARGIILHRWAVVDPLEALEKAGITINMNMHRG